MKKIFILMLFFTFSMLLAENAVLKGKISDKNGAVIAYALIELKGTAYNTVSNEKGFYKIRNIKPGKYIVNCIHTDYEPVSKNIRLKRGAQRTINFTLKHSDLKDGRYYRKSSMKKAARSNRRIGKNPPPPPKMFNGHGKMAAGAEMSIAPPVSGRGEVVVPHNTEEYKYIKENRFLSVTENPLSTFSIDVDAASYSNVRRFLNNNQMPVKDAVRIEELINYFSYDYKKPEGKHPFSVNTEYSDCPWNKRHKLLHIGLKGREIEYEERKGSNLVFLIDVSGSMRAPNKLPLLKKSYTMLVSKLDRKDRVSIVVYAGAAGLVLRPTPGDEKSDILQAIGRLNAGGSTAGGAGIELAYKTAEENFVKGGNNRIILATDGDFNIGTSSTSELERLIEKKRKSGVYLTILGFGMGNYKDGRMESLADKGNGNYYYIDNILEAKKVLVTDLMGTLFAIAKDVKLQLEFNPENVEAYRLIGYENRKLAKEDFNDDTKDAGELGAGHTVTALYEIVPKGVKIKLPEVDKLKYQGPKGRSGKRGPGNSGFKDELLTVKLRYKLPGKNNSIKLEKIVKNRPDRINNTTDNFRFSASVATFGMLLRDSEFKGNSSWKLARKLAKGAMGKDKYGYRSEFLNLIEKASLLGQ